MNETRLLKNAIRKNLPDLEETRKRCLSAPSKKKAPLRRWAPIAALCTIALICTSVIHLYGENERPAFASPISLGSDSTLNPSDEIRLNTLSSLSAFKLNVQAKEASSPRYDNLQNLSVPEDLSEISYYDLYGQKRSPKKDLSAPYDVFLCSVAYFSEPSEEKKIRIAMSDQETPPRCYLFPDTGDFSVINQIEMPLYQYEDSYMTTFFYDGIYFDVETSGISLEEFVSALSSITK